MPHVEFHDGYLEFEPFDCICGQHHKLPIRKIIARQGALRDIVPALEELDLGRRVILVSDDNTYDVAGEVVEKQLRDSHRQVSRCNFATREWVKPDEQAIGNLLFTMEADTELLVVVGSGCLTDTTRFVSYRTGVPFVAVATAPSMDGYASTGAPMTHGGFKRTYYTTHAQAVFADIDVLASAPQPMIASGFGDTIGKLTSRVDWKLSNLVRGEYYCPVLVDLVNRGVDRCIEQATSICVAEPDGVGTLTEALLMSGIAMLIVGNSRPASGSEHSLSHYWEMKAALTGHREFFHGTKVGVATVVIALFAERFFARDPSTVDPKARRDSLSVVAARLRAGLGSVADSIVETISTPAHLDAAARAAEITTITERWSEISALAKSIPSAAEVLEFQRRAGAPALPSEIEVDSDYLLETLVNAKEIRSRYCLLRAAETLGWLDDIVEEVVSGMAAL